MSILIQKTSPEYFPMTETLTREAFWNIYSPGCDEHLILHQLRESSSYIPGLDLIAVYEKEIIAHIISTRAKVINKQNKEQEVLCLGPVSVSPSHQKKGVGTILINHSISEARKMGFKGIIIFGNPDYYHRFGFLNAEIFDITTKDDRNFEPFMALELKENGLENIKGRFFEDKAYAVKEADLIEFEKKFPPKEKGKPAFDISNYEI